LLSGLTGQDRTGQGKYPTLHYTTLHHTTLQRSNVAPVSLLHRPDSVVLSPLFSHTHSLTLEQVGVSFVARERDFASTVHGHGSQSQRRVQAIVLLPERALGAQAGMERGALWDCAAARGWGSGGARLRESERRLGGDEAMRIWGHGAMR
jgi:hypothetical protein